MTPERRARFKELLADMDLAYAVPLFAAVAVFVLAMFAYFGTL
jgi:hypothetical protein